MKRTLFALFAVAFVILAALIYFKAMPATSVTAIQSNDIFGKLKELIEWIGTLVFGEHAKGIVTAVTGKQLQPAAGDPPEPKPGSAA